VATTMRTAECHPERKHYAHGQCFPCYLRENKHRFPSTTSEYRRERYDRDAHRGYRLKGKYGLTPDEYDELLAAQGGVCAICAGPPDGRWPRYAVDHDHETGEVRGLLCTRCNRAIGLLRDSTDLVLAVLEYLDPRRTRK